MATLKKRKREAPAVGAARASRSVVVLEKPFTSFGTMESKKAKQEFDFKVRLRMFPELVKWLIGAILMGGGALTAATHWGN
jgi:hypothetical protein